LFPPHDHRGLARLTGRDRGPQCSLTGPPALLVHLPGVMQVGKPEPTWSPQCQCLPRGMFVVGGEQVGGDDTRAEDDLFRDGALRVASEIITPG
jgi:hypothetical protein